MANRPYLFAPVSEPTGGWLAILPLKGFKINGLFVPGGGLEPHD